MGAENNPESVFNIEDILDQFTRALSAASLGLQQTFESARYRDLPYTYHIPKMSITLNIALSYSKGKVKGIFKKTQTKETSQQESHVALEVVSIPRGPLKPSAAPPSGIEEEPPF